MRLKATGVVIGAYDSVSVAVSFFFFVFFVVLPIISLSNSASWLTANLIQKLIIFMLSPLVISKDINVEVTPIY